MFVKVFAVFALECWRGSCGGAWKCPSLMREGMYHRPSLRGLLCTFCGYGTGGLAGKGVCSGVRLLRLLSLLSHFLAVGSRTSYLTSLCLSVFVSEGGRVIILTSSGFRGLNELTRVRCWAYEVITPASYSCAGDLGESLALDSCAVTRIEGRTSSPGAGRIIANPRLCFLDTHFFPCPIYLGMKG